MRIKCAFSGLDFSCEHFPASLRNRESYHPIFSIPQKELFQFTRKWSARELTEIDSYLLYLALLNSTELLDWRTHAIRTPQTPRIVESNMASLVHIVGKMNLINHPSFVCSHIAITPDTRDLSNSHYWIANWNEAYTDFINGYKEAKLHDRLVSREAAIAKLIKDDNKPIDAYARHLADWAEMASEFPTYVVRVNNQPIPINEYWKNIIVACCKEERIFLIPREHVEKLLEHLEDNLHAGIQTAGGDDAAYTLLRLIRSGLKKQHNYLGLGDFDLPSKTSFELLDGTETAEDINRAAMIMSAPDKKPIESEYPSKIAYLRARFKWDAKEEHLARQAAVKVLNDELLAKAENDEPEIEEIEESEIDEEDLKANGLNIAGIGEL